MRLNRHTIGQNYGISANFANILLNEWIGGMCCDSRKGYFQWILQDFLQHRCDLVRKMLPRQVGRGDW